MNIYDTITERICTMLQSGVAPWQKPWQVNRGLPRNFVSKRPYSGINTWLLHSCQFESPYWLTYRQAQEQGAQVKRGEKSCPVVFWREIETEDRKTGEAKSFPMLRFYYLFNLAQVQGLKDTPVSTVEPSVASSILSGYKDAPQVKHGFASAFYSPSDDTVSMPDKSHFATEGDYYATLYHELVHSTGHKSRLDRLTPTSFGSDAYSSEELIAELGSAFLCCVAGVDRKLETNAAYLAGWLKVLRQDNKLIIKTSTQAQRATDYIIGTKKD